MQNFYPAQLPFRNSCLFPRTYLARFTLRCLNCWITLTCWIMSPWVIYTYRPANLFENWCLEIESKVAWIRGLAIWALPKLTARYIKLKEKRLALFVWQLWTKTYTCSEWSALSWSLSAGVYLALSKTRKWNKSLSPWACIVGILLTSICHFTKSTSPTFSGVSTSSAAACSWCIRSHAGFRSS